MPAKPSPRATLASRVRAWLPILVVGAVLAVAGVVAIPLGGWDTVQLQSAVIPEQSVGDTFVGNRLAISIDDLYLTDDFPDDYTETKPGESFLVVVATLEGLTAEPESPISIGPPSPFTIDGLMNLDERPGYGDLTVFLKRDGTFEPVLSPGVPDTLLFVFTVRSGQFAQGDVLRIGLTDATPEKADIIDGTRWVDEHVAVEVSTTVRDDR
ncbi:MAG: hypothetical protein ABIR17_04585 [Pseudolysinimonas sp.]|uniref:hypothetical protein n=1 Tax=Pseudolysinimonas sp. TaxID=2680009 RepID=UPI003266A451